MGGEAGGAEGEAQVSAIFRGNDYGNGNGNGDGYGYGYGNGYGNGNGYGDGNGYPEQEIGGSSAKLAGAAAREGIGDLPLLDLMLFTLDGES